MFMRCYASLTVAGQALLNLVAGTSASGCSFTCCKAPAGQRVLDDCVCQKSLTYNTSTGAKTVDVTR